MAWHQHLGSFPGPAVEGRTEPPEKCPVGAHGSWEGSVHRRGVCHGLSLGAEGMQVVPAGTGIFGREHMRGSGALSSLSPYLPILVFCGPHFPGISCCGELLWTPYLGRRGRMIRETEQGQNPGWRWGRAPSNHSWLRCSMNQEPRWRTFCLLGYFWNCRW